MMLRGSSFVYGRGIDANGFKQLNTTPVFPQFQEAHLLMRFWFQKVLHK